MAENDANELPPMRGEMYVNGARVAAVDYVKRDEGLDLTFRDESGAALANVDGMTDTDDKVALLGLQNFMRVNRGEAQGTLSGESLSVHQSLLFRDGSAAVMPQRAQVEQGEPWGDDNFPAADQVDIEPQAEPAEARPTAAPEPADDDAEAARRAAIERAVRQRFTVEGDVYRFRDGARGVAFRDHGTRLTTATNDARTARAFAELADARGWNQIRVTGHKDFRREVWVEATARGVTVEGYKPTEQDRETAQDRASERETNSVQPGNGRARERGGRERAETPDAEQRPPRARRSDSLDGVLVEHGSAPYRHDPDAGPSYRAVLEDAAGGTTETWGVDIERAIGESGAQPGDRVQLERQGRQTVTVTARERDENGQMREVEREAERVTWAVRVVESRGESAVRERAFDAIARDKTRSEAGAEALSKELREQHAERVAGGAQAIPVALLDPATRSSSLRRGEVVSETSAEKSRGRETEQGAEASI